MYNVQCNLSEKNVRECKTPSFGRGEADPARVHLSIELVQQPLIQRGLLDRIQDPAYFVKVFNHGLQTLLKIFTPRYIYIYYNRQKSKKRGSRFEIRQIKELKTSFHLHT